MLVPSPAAGTSKNKHLARSLRPGFCFSACRAGTVQVFPVNKTMQWLNPAHSKPWWLVCLRTFPTGANFSCLSAICQLLLSYLSESPGSIDYTNPNRFAAY
jgi:hypothetical protein